LHFKLECGYKLKEAVRHKFSKKNYSQRDWKAYDVTPGMV